uniref:Lysosomal alpha-mannosidase n=1 Tax=Gadus morhua TaxID=8049 RepID=A0A8C5AWH7_GADMO
SRDPARHKHMSHDRCLYSNMVALSPVLVLTYLSYFHSAVLSFPLDQQSHDTSSCGYKVMPNMLNVHLVPHTHDDVGWLKTVDQYFYGGRNDIQHAGVQYILDSVVGQLLQNPERRFIYVETAFFYRWWKNQPPSMQKAVRQLVDQGRLEFVNGGWCMSDEATTHYSAVIDQMTLGLRFLNDTFGPCGRPRVAWHIDPFGHAREHASMFAQMGYDGFFFGRLDYQDRTNRIRTLEQELLWRASESLEPPYADLFTGILPNGYNPPKGFCWDQSCDDAPIMDDPDLEDYNVDDVVQRFAAAANSQAMAYKTKHIIMTMGSDFQYENANLWYKNLDKLIRYVNTRQANGSQINVLYSTPSCYLQELHRANLTWTLKTDDFFPYADDAHNFWTGYFTSRPALKRYERVSNGRLQTCNQLEVLGGPSSRKGPFGAGDSETLREAMAVAQHHDAVSGTEKQHVANDYARRLANGWQHCQVVVSNSLAALSGSSAGRIYCDNLNVSACPLTEASKKVTDIHAHSCTHAPVKTKIWIEEYFFNRVCVCVCVCVCQFVRATFDPATGLLDSLTNLETQQTIRLTQNFYWYNASDGKSSISDQASGAYIFRPNSSSPFIISCTAETESIQTPELQEVRQQFGPWVSQVIRLHSNSKALEMEWTVGPVPDPPRYHSPALSRLAGVTSWSHRKDFRPTWDLRQTEPVAGNYYPINSRAYIKDDKDQLTVVTDRSQGGSSIHDGSLEIMLHRRLLHDDWRGVGEPLNEMSGVFPLGLVVRGRLLLSLTPPALAADAHRPLAQENVLQPLLSFTEGGPPPGSLLEVCFSGLQAALPPAVHLLTLSQWGQDSLLIRLEHQFQTKESKEHSVPFTVNLQVYTQYTHICTWEPLGTHIHTLFPSQSIINLFMVYLIGKDSVILTPMQIRTFILRVAPRR